MAKKIVYFNSTKQIETLTIHYNDKLDGAFVEDVCRHIKEISKKMSGVNLKNPREFDAIQVFVYPSEKLFNQVFGGEIEKRFYSKKRSLEDLYVVQDAEGNIHIVSPRGKAQEKRDALKKILVMKVLGEYMDEKKKLEAEKILKVAMKPKEEEKEEEKIEEDIAEEDIEELEDEFEEEVEELDEEELEELIETEEIIDNVEDIEKLDKEEIEEKKEEISQSKKEARQWLDAGWFMYVRGRLKKKEDIEKFAENISKKGIKKLGDLKDTKVFESYNYSKEYACAMVEYIVENYGAKKFAEFYENPKDIEGVFGVSKYRFNGDLKAYIYSKYSSKEMKMEMDKRNVAEITKVHFTKSGGADIVTDKEMKERTIEKVK